MNMSMSMAEQSFDRARAGELIAAKAGLDGALLPILHDLQQAFDHVPEGALPLIAEALNLSLADVRGVVSFYHDFKREPSGRHVLKICRAESCQAMGGEALVAYLAKAHQLAPGETSKDQSLTLEAVYCLGQCACSPAALFDNEPIGRVNPAMLDELVLQAAGTSA